MQDEVFKIDNVQFKIKRERFEIKHEGEMEEFLIGSKKPKYEKEKTQRRYQRAQ